MCSGIEAATVAWEPLGWKAAWYSEIEKFPCAVLNHHYPAVPNYGDMTKFKEWNSDRSIDVLVGGTPCQSFSIAGLRKGLDDPRGNLMLTFGSVADKYRPKWIVWENVPGVLSSNRGKDFGTFLGMLAELGYGFSYRVLDAQNFGVPQRRRRVFVVGYLGDWRPSAAVLFESDSLRRDFTKSGKTGKRIAQSVTQGAPFSRTWNERIECEALVFSSIDSGIDSSIGLSPNSRAQTGNMAVLMAADGRSKFKASASASALRAGGAKQTDVDIICMAHGQANADIGIGIGTTLSCNHEAPIVCPSLTASNNPSRSPQSSEVTAQIAAVVEATNAIVLRMREGKAGGGKGPLISDKSLTLATNNYQILEYGIQGGERTSQSSQGSGINEEKCFTLNNVDAHGVAGFLPGQGSKAQGMGYESEMAPALRSGAQVGAKVRRLTPVRCERLQGFPDNYTRIPWGKKPPEECPDGPRYKALGNSMAVPVMRWIGERIQMVEDLLIDDIM